MEIQVEFLGSDVALELVLVWFLFSHVDFLTGCKLFILKVMPICIYTFLNRIHFLFSHVDFLRTEITACMSLLF